MIVIGIVGGIASGKSYISKAFERRGAMRVDADLIGHEILAETQTKKSIKNAWGDRVFDSMGNVDRKALAAIVFQQDNKNLVLLEQITHPKISLRLREILGLEKSNYPAVVLDAPVLFKAGWDKFCQRIVFVDCPREIRLRRAMKRGWTEEMFDDRETAQIDLEQKRSRSTDIIDGAATNEQIEQAVNEFWINWNLPS